MSYGEFILCDRATEVLGTLQYQTNLHNYFLVGEDYFNTAVNKIHSYVLKDSTVNLHYLSELT